MLRSMSFVILFTGCLLFSGFAFAGQASDSFSVKVKVVSHCTIKTNDLNFSQAYDPSSSTPDTAQADLSLSCTKDAPAAVKLSAGNSGNAGARYLQNGTSKLNYAIYQPAGAQPDAACNDDLKKVWGDSGNEIFKPVIPGDMKKHVYHVCGWIGAGQNVNPGTYSDNITATVTF